MSDRFVGAKKHFSSVVAISQDGKELRAVEVRAHSGMFELLWAKSREGSEKDLALFAGECGLSIEQGDKAIKDGEKTVVVGFNSAGVALYRIWMPALKEKEMAGAVRLQAETWLPLPAEQVELAWRTGRTRNGEVAVTIAVGRKERLQGFLGNIGGMKPAKILLDCEGVVRVWRAFFSGREGDAVVMSMGARSTQVSLVNDGRLANAAVLDVGVDALSAGETVEQTEITESFVQDARGVLELFGCDEPGDLPVFVLSDGSDVIASIVSLLRSAGLDAREALPLAGSLKTAEGLGIKELYEYRVPTGLALMELEGEAGLNIFEQLYRPFEVEEKKSWLYELKVAAVAAAVMLVALVIVSYAVDVASPGVIERRLKASVSEADMNVLVQKKKLIKAVVAERPDLLEILNYVNAKESRGILLDSFQFKKGQPVSISGQADNPDVLYKFQETLLTKKGISGVEIQNASKDPKGDKYKFTIIFHYKNFTKKGTVMQRLTQ